MTRLLRLGILALCLSGCSSTPSEVEEGQTQSFPVDSWYHLAPDGVSPSSLAQKLKVVEVSEAFEVQAENLLRSQGAISISSAQAKQMSGGSYQGTGTPFLVRAIYFNRETGVYEVVQNGANLFISHSSLGHSAVPMKRQVLILDLPQVPGNIYVYCDMAA